MIAILLAAILQTAVPMRSIAQGLNSDIDAARQVTVRTADEWSKLWTQHAGESRKPEVDFNKDIVVAVFMGTRPSAAFSIEIVGTRVDGTTLIVTYKETRPAPGGVAAQILTSPYHIVAVPKGTATDVKFERAN